MEKKRIFAAIDISDDARERVTEYIRSLQHEFKDIPVRWEKPEKLHITVRFVGSIKKDELEKFSAHVAKAASGTPPFSITINETGGFVKSSSRSNVLWLGLVSKSSDGTTAMIEKLAARIDNVGQTKRLHPHLTIARLKDAKKARHLIEKHLYAGFEAVTFDAKAITVYESKLLPTGSVYTALSRHRFS